MNGCRWQPFFLLLYQPSISMKIRLCLVLYILSMIACQPKSDAPTLILSNGKIWTGESDSSFVEAVAIQGNIILETGNSETISALAGPETEVIDLQGKLVTAGFNDAHIHFLGGSMGLTQVELSAAETFEEAMASTLQFITDNPEKDWITGRGWQYTFSNPVFLTMNP